MFIKSRKIFVTHSWQSASKLTKLSPTAAGNKKTTQKNSHTLK